MHMRYVALVSALVAALLLAGQLARAARPLPVKNDGFPALSSNGRDFAFQRNVAGVGDHVLDGAQSGKSIHVVADGWLRGFLPGTEHVLVQTGSTTVLVADDDRFLPPFATFHGTQLSTSRDGTRVAYLRGQTLYVANADATGERSIATGIDDPDADVTGAAWSPDGTKLAYASGSTIWVAGSDGSGAVAVYPGSGISANPSWSADGKTIAFESKNGPFWAVEEVGADGSQPRLVSGASNARFPRFSPIGGELAWISDREHRRGGATRYQYALYVDGRKLVNDVKPDGPPAWAPTAALIAVAAGRPCNRFGVVILRPQVPAHARRVSNLCSK
jgi:dipeptidyl aminopeptidase/acylaminoacyl peptidase